MKLLPLLTLTAALPNLTLAHYRWTSLILNGAATADYQYVRRNTNYNSPVQDVTSPDIRCNAGGLSSGPSTLTAPVVAGSTVGFKLDQAIFHPGPITVYLSKAPGKAADYDGSGAWFKIAELGASITSTAITFPASNIVAYSFRIPLSTPPGEYLLRIEHIALHVAQSAGAAQFYIACAQVNISGSGGGSPGPTISLPGGYKASDPGILININWPIPTSYTIPGPKVWSG